MAKKKEEEIEGDFDDDDEETEEEIEVPEAPKVKKKPKAKPEVESEEDLKLKQAEIAEKLAMIDFEKTKSEFFTNAPKLLGDLSLRVTELESQHDELRTHFNLLRQT